MTIDWGFISAVSWPYVLLLSGAVFAASLIGNIISFKSRFFGALLAAALFGALYIFLYHYPHGLNLPLPPRSP